MGSPLRHCFTFSSARPLISRRKNRVQIEPCCSMGGVRLIIMPPLFGVRRVLLYTDWSMLVNCITAYGIAMLTSIDSTDLLRTISLALKLPEGRSRLLFDERRTF